MISEPIVVHFQFTNISQDYLVSKMNQKQVEPKKFYTYSQKKYKWQKKEKRNINGYVVWKPGGGGGSSDGHMENVKLHGFPGEQFENMYQRTKQ